MISGTTMEHDDGISKIIPHHSLKGDEKIVLIDADSILHFTLYSGKDEYGNKNPVYTIDDLEYLQGKLTEFIYKIINNIEQYFPVKQYFLFIKGEGNFRKELYPEYKANRPPADPIINYLYEYIISVHSAISSNGVEAEDYVFTFFNKLEGKNTIICYVDHDLEEIPECIMYNYRKNTWKYNTEKDALWSKYSKLVIGESGDNANFCPRIGRKYFERVFHKDMSVDEYEEKVYETYVLAWSTKVKVRGKTQKIPDYEKAREMLNLAKKITWLKDVEDE